MADSYQYWKFIFTPPSGGITEISQVLFYQTSTNVPTTGSTFTGSFSASSSGDGTSPSAAFDGNNTSTYWQNAASDTTPYLQVDFGSPITFTSIDFFGDLYPYSLSPVTVDVQVSNDGVSYTDLGSYTFTPWNGETQTYNVVFPLFADVAQAGVLAYATSDPAALAIQNGALAYTTADPLAVTAQGGVLAWVSYEPPVSTDVSQSGVTALTQSLASAVPAQSGIHALTQSLSSAVPTQSGVLALTKAISSAVVAQAGVMALVRYYPPLNPSSGGGSFMLIT